LTPGRAGVPGFDGAEADGTGFGSFAVTEGADVGTVTEDGSVGAPGAVVGSLVQPASAKRKTATETGADEVCGFTPPR
jgi:hypothetical protein